MSESRNDLHSIDQLFNCFLLLRQCPACSHKVRNLYQHCKIKHQCTLRSLITGVDKVDLTEKNGLTMEASEAVGCFTSWLLSVDGGRLKEKTASMYHTCINRVISEACQGQLTNFLRYASWSAPGGFLEILGKRVSPATVSTYIQSMISFAEFLASQSGRQFMSVPKNFAPTAVSVFKRWNLSLRQERQIQRVAVISEAQSIIPLIAEKMKKFESSDQYK